MVSLACAALLAATGLLLAAEATEEKELGDGWVAVYLKEQRIGYVHTHALQRGEGAQALFATETEQHISVTRGQTTTAVTMRSEVVEDRKGRLVSFKNVLEQGRVRQTASGEVKEGKLVLQTGAGDASQTRTVDVPDALCPWAATLVAKAWGYKDGTAYSLSLFMPESPEKAVTASVTIGDAEPQQVFEVTKWLHRAEMTLSSMPDAKMVQWVDDEGTPWLARMRFGLLEIEMRKVPKEVALQPPENVEMMLSCGIAPDHPIDRPRTLESLQLLLEAEGKDVKLDLPAGPYQEVTKREGGVELKLRRAHGDPARSYRLPYAQEEHADLLKATPWLEIQSPLIVQMSKEAVGDETDALKAARRIERYVGEQIKEKTLGLGFATAAETARQKAGDCTEHAVLAAALARAAGIPSRVAVGLAYAGPMPPDKEAKFYYHMWTELYVGEWLPLDATLGSHDATHIALASNALDKQGSLFELSGPVLRFIGAVRIKVLKVGE